MQSIHYVSNMIRFNHLKSRILLSKSCAHQICRHFNSLRDPDVFDYDLVVIGGAPGGLAAAKEAASLGAKVVVADYEAPILAGASWGLRGSGANVGSIQKKLMHQAALLGDALQDAQSFGWKISGKTEHSWQKLTGALQAHLQSLNSTNKQELRDKNISYISGHARFESSRILQVATNQEEVALSAKYFLIAVEGFPKYPDIPGALDYGITSDDIFTLKHPPGKSLIVGAGCSGLECSGALNVLGYETTVMFKDSIPLRGCDQQMASIVKAEMESRGVRFLLECLPESIEKNHTGKLQILYSNKTKQKFSAEFDTILFAIGRRSLINELQLERAGVQTDLTNGKIIAKNEQTNVPHIYAIGEVLYGFPDQTPVATQAGRLLSRRLFGGSRETVDYENIPTTIFTPLEYGFVGHSEEEAHQRYGGSEIEVYHSFYKPPEYSVSKKSTSNCYLKVVSSRDADQKVLGMHFIGPQAGEIIQGFSAAMKCGLTVESLINTVGIHPTLAEEFTKINITKRSGRDPTPASCCS
ncbi:thioredoxin reductase 1, mitochondrial [Dendroctonus ponderosae]|nr:thioredoxin reductase 1, mitochondrial [Dendroctonus ponderosae]